MAPEQLLGRETDFRTDHFSLGVLLYEAATGRHPFGGSSLDSVIAQILTVPPEVPDMPGEMPVALWTVIERSLRKDPAQRFASTRELAAALEAARDEIARASSLPLAAATTSPPIAALAASADACAPMGERSGAAQMVALSSVGRGARLLDDGVAGLDRPWLPGPRRPAFFFALLAASSSPAIFACICGSRRVSTRKTWPPAADVSRWIRGGDIAFAALLIIGGIALPESVPAGRRC